MSRINDVGGMQGFGPVMGDAEEARGVWERRRLDPGGAQRRPSDEEERPFEADWEARVFALAGVLQAQGRFTSDELRDAIERMPAEAYLHASYYERWFAGICTLLVEKGLIDAADLEGVGA